MIMLETGTREAFEVKISTLPSRVFHANWIHFWEPVESSQGGCGSSRGDTHLWPSVH
jgi:hypothetical protein